MVVLNGVSMFGLIIIKILKLPKRIRIYDDTASVFGYTGLHIMKRRPLYSRGALGFETPSLGVLIELTRSRVARD